VCRTHRGRAGPRHLPGAGRPPRVGPPPLRLTVKQGLHVHLRDGELERVEVAVVAPGVFGGESNDEAEPDEAVEAFDDRLAAEPRPVVELLAVAAVRPALVLGEGDAALPRLRPEDAPGGVAEHLPLVRRQQMHVAVSVIVKRPVAVRGGSSFRYGDATEGLGCNRYYTTSGSVPAPCDPNTFWGARRARTTSRTLQLAPPRRRNALPKIGGGRSQ
jgi:hypothetical protein